MFRTSRTIASIIRNLTLGTAATLATATLATSLMSCKDESQPEYWVDKLEDGAYRARAVKRLDQFFEDAVTKANKNMDDPNVKALLDKIVVPLTNCYVNHYADFGSDVKTRVSLIKLISAFRDPRTEPALKKALEEFVKKPTKSGDETDIRWAFRADEDLKLPGLSDALLQTFMKVELHSPLGELVKKDLRECMIANLDKAWAPSLRKLLEGEMPEFKPETQATVKNQAYWQILAALLLGDLGDAEAVRPLMKVVLDPNKGPVAVTAILALVKIGDPSVQAALKLLTGEDKELVEYHLAKVKAATGAKEAPKDEPYVWMAATILGTTGSPKAAAPMIEALKTTKQDGNKAKILAELAKLPPTPQIKAAFQEGFAALKMDTMMPGLNAPAGPILVEAAFSRFYDPGMLDWLLEYTEGAELSSDNKVAFQLTVLTTAMKLAKPSQMGTVKALIPKWGEKAGKDSKDKYLEDKLYRQAEAVAKECGEKVACYLEYVSKSDTQKKENEFGGIKAAYMIAVFGDENAAKELVNRIDMLENASIAASALYAIDFLLPKGSEEVADKFKEILAAHEKTADQHTMQSDAVIREVMYRVRARAKG